METWEFEPSRLSFLSSEITPEEEKPSNCSTRDWPIARILEKRESAVWVGGRDGMRHSVVPLPEARFCRPATPLITSFEVFI